MDKTTKVLLAAIALGLWAHVAALAIKPAKADVDDIKRIVHSIQSTVDDIKEKADDIYKEVDDIDDGHCHNSKICDR